MISVLVSLFYACVFCPIIAKNNSDLVFGILFVIAVCFVEFYILHQWVFES